MVVRRRMVRSDEIEIPGLFSTDMFHCGLLYWILYKDMYGSRNPRFDPSFKYLQRQLHMFFLVTVSYF